MKICPLTSGREEFPSPEPHFPDTLPIDHTDFLSQRVYYKQEGKVEKESLIIEFGQLVPQDYSMVHTSSRNSDQIDDTPAGAIPVHGQSNSCRVFQVVEKRREWLSFKACYLPLQSSRGLTLSP